MKVLITGLTGFIGKGLQKQLPRDYEYFALNRRDQDFGEGVRLLLGDLNHLDKIKPQIRRIRPDICIHLAWEGIPDYGYVNSWRNLINSTDLFRFLVTECGCRKIVATGSCWEYGKVSGPCREDEPSGSENYFAWAKRALCDFGLTLAREENITFIWLRLFYVYGLNQRPDSLIPTLIKALKIGNRPAVNAPLNANDFVDVADVAQALIKAALDKVSSGIYNVGSGVSTPVWRICELIEQALGIGTEHFKQLKSSSRKAAMDFWADTTKAREALQWSASTSLEQGIKKYLNLS